MVNQLIGTFVIEIGNVIIGADYTITMFGARDPDGPFSGELGKNLYFIMEKSNFHIASLDQEKIWPR